MQAVLLAVAAWRNLHQLNPDAIAYMRIAGYYANGQTELAVTGYWGPLLSWLMVPLLKVGAPPLVAARVVMGVSGVVFLAGAVAVFRVFRLPRVALLTGAWVAGGWSVFWSVRNITPDLLMAGLVALAVTATMELFLRRSRRGEEAEHVGRTRIRILTSAATAGLWWGLAYLAKAVALPLALAAAAGLAVFAMSGRRGLRAELAARLGMVCICTALVAAPWLGVLSQHYGRFTFSTTGPIAHALAGPGEKAGFHPAMTTLHQPEAGRVTQWEEPSRMAYQRWSPFASEENFRHQLKVIGGNIGVCWDWLNPWRAWVAGADSPPWRRWLGTFDLLGISGMAVLLAGGCAVRNRHRLRRVRWCWALVPVAALGGLYLPFFVMAEDNRYFYTVLPFLWVLAVGASGWAARRKSRVVGGTRQLAFRIVSLAFVTTALAWLAVALVRIPNQASRAAHEIAVQLKLSGHVGPVAGSGLLPGGRTGLYTAFLLGERWLGDDSMAGPEAFLASGATVVVVRRSSHAELFARNPSWHLAGRGASEQVLYFVRATP